MLEEVRATPGIWWRSLQREQRIAVLVLGTAAISVFVLAVVHVRASVVSPFRVSKNVLDQSQKILAQIEQDERKEIELRTKDTDRDGLSDYDELSVYHTSPYLPDSDSDSIPDAIELSEGSDPNCPKGKNCSETYDHVFTGNASSSLQDLLDVADVPSPVAALLGSASSVQGAQAFINAPPSPDSMNPARIRAYFAEKNLLPQEQLQVLTDTQLTEVYAAAYQEAIQVQRAYQSPTSTGFKERAPGDLFGE